MRKRRWKYLRWKRKRMMRRRKKKLGMRGLRWSRRGILRMRGIRRRIELRMRMKMIRMAKHYRVLFIILDFFYYYINFNCIVKGSLNKNCKIEYK